MPVYGKHMNGKQKSCAKQFEQISGFEFMYQDDIDSGDMCFEDAWNSNIQWLENMTAEVSSISTQGAWVFRP